MCSQGRVLLGLREGQWRWRDIQKAGPALECWGQGKRAAIHQDPQAPGSTAGRGGVGCGGEGGADLDPLHPVLDRKQQGQGKKMSSMSLNHEF